MNTPSSAIALWDNGRLVLRQPEPPFEMSAGQALEAALWVACAVMLALFVAVLEHGVHRNEMRQAELRARAIAEAECESSRPAETRAACLAVFDGGSPDAAVATADAAPVNSAYAGAGLSMAGLGAGAQ
jgi:hypothetical protein